MSLGEKLKSLDERIDFLNERQGRPVYTGKSYPIIDRLLSLFDENVPEHWSIEFVRDVKAVISDRIADGTKKYGQPLSTFNGRNARVDAIQEVFDLLAYLVQSEMEAEKENNWVRINMINEMYPGILATCYHLYLLIREDMKNVVARG